MKVLFICTHNRCRSILSEAVTNHIAGANLIAASAGSQPVGQVHPLSLRYLQEAGIPTDGLYSKSWDELECFAPDVVITVCDSAAGEICPVWFGKAIKIHWGLQDPSRLIGSESEIAGAFRQTIAQVSTRAKALQELAQKNLPVKQLAAELAALSKQNQTDSFLLRNN